MGIRERKIENYLRSEVGKLGGITRKWTSPDNPGVPDQIVIINGESWYVEVKTTEGKLEGKQRREHKRLEFASAKVRTVYGHSGVDEFIREVENES